MEPVLCDDSAYSESDLVSVLVDFESMALNSAVETVVVAEFEAWAVQDSLALR